MSGRPSGPPPRPFSEDRPERVFKVWLGTQDRAPSRLQVREIAADTQQAKQVNYRPTARVNRTGAAVSAQESEPALAQHARSASTVEVKLDPAAWQVIQPAWQAGHCDVLAEVAAALDQISITASASLAYRVVVRLQGMPEIVHALVGEVVARSAAAYDCPPLPTLANHLRQVGVAVCSGTEVGACASLGAVAERLGRTDVEHLSGMTERELSERLIGELDLPVFWTGRTMPVLGEVFHSLVTAPGRTVESEADVSAPRAPEGRLDATREAIRVAHNPDTVTAPVTFGHAGE